MSPIFYFVILVAFETLFADGDENRCRLSRFDTALPPLEFGIEGCLKCFEYNNHNRMINITDIIDIKNTTLDEMLQNEEILLSLNSTKAQEDWKNCCDQAVLCCSLMISQPTVSEEGWCPRTWDGWLCWNDTKPDSDSKQYCPSYSVSSKCSPDMAVKTCTENGTWASHPDWEFEWTDYNMCAGVERHSRGVFLSLGAYVASFISLIPALFIFYKFSVLHCFRVQLHRNLFLSLLLHAKTQIIFHCAVLLKEIGHTHILDQSGSVCRLLSILITYFTVSNYVWMFCEGFYLCRQLIRVFKEETRLWMFRLIGWGVPIVPVLVLVTSRLIEKDQTCWALPSAIDWVWLLPCLLSLLVNSIFFIYILRVLVKLLRNHRTDRAIQFQKAVHAAIVLIPLFGLHFLLTIYRPDPVCTLAEQYHLYLNRLLEGLQGALVALTFCYVNSEVRAALGQTWRTLVDRQQMSTSHSNCNGQTTCTTVQTIF